MSQIQVNGTIDNPEPSYTHEEPVGPFSGGMIAAGTTTQIAVPGFKNTGNLPQTLTVAITNLTGVTVSSFYIEVPGSQATPTSVTLNPGYSAILRVNVQAPNYGPADDSDYSFEIDTSWTH